MIDTHSTLIVDDHPVFRLGLRRALEGTVLRVIGEAETGSEALNLALRLTPEIVLLDLGLPDQDGFEVCRCLRVSSPGSVIVILSSYDDAATIRASRSAGAHGHVPKGTSVPKLIEHAVWLKANEGMTLFESSREGTLTDRELDVIEAMALGLHQPEIAMRLGIGVETVKSYVRSAYDKLGVNDRASALRMARQLKLIEAPPSRGYRR